MSNMPETGPPKQIQYDAITEKKVTIKQAEEHCRKTLNIAGADPKEITKQVEWLDAIRKKVQEKGDSEVRSLFVLLARSKPVTKQDSSAVIDTYDDLVRAWKAPKPSLSRCLTFYDIVTMWYETYPGWLSETATCIRNTLNLDIIGEGEGKFKNFIEEIIIKKCHVNSRSFLKQNRNTVHTVGISQRMASEHPCGKAVASSGRQTFQLQNIIGYEALCRDDPVAAAICVERQHKMYMDETVEEALKRHAAGDSEGGTFVSSFKSNSASAGSRRSEYSSDLQFTNPTVTPKTDPPPLPPTVVTVPLTVPKNSDETNGGMTAMTGDQGTYMTEVAELFVL